MSINKKNEFCKNKKVSIEIHFFVKKRKFLSVARFSKLKIFLAKVFNWLFLVSHIVLCMIIFDFRCQSFRSTNFFWTLFIPFPLYLLYGEIFVGWSLNFWFAISQEKHTNYLKLVAFWYQANTNMSMYFMFFFLF